MSGTSRVIRRLKRPIFRKRIKPSSTAIRALRIAKKALNELNTLNRNTSLTLNAAPTITQLLVDGDPNTQELDYTKLHMEMEVRQNLTSSLQDSWRVMIILDR